MAVPIGVSFASTAVMVGSPTWTRIDNTYKVLSWSIDRGRQFELDKTGTGTATVELVDENGDFDPTSGPLVDVLNHAAIAVQNPVTGSTATLFRGYVDAVHWTPYVSGAFANVRIELVDAFAIFSAMELPVKAYSGSTVTVNSDGNLVFPALAFADAVQRRIGDGTHYGGILTDVGWPTTLRSIFSGNVKLQQTVYAPRTSLLSVLQDAADAEFPGVANLYMSKDGKVTFHGRLARFDPEEPSYGIGSWTLGDTPAVESDPTTVVPISPPIVLSRDSAHLYSSAWAMPQDTAGSFTSSEIQSQYATDSGASATYGLRTWTADNLLTSGGTANTALQETKLFANYYKDNYSTVRTRVGQVTVRPQHPTGASGSATWALMCGVEISDQVVISTTHVGGGGLADVFFVEGVHYEAKPLNATNPEVTLTLDVSPAGYYGTNPF